MISMCFHIIHFQLNSDTTSYKVIPIHARYTTTVNSCKEFKFNIQLWSSPFCKYINWLISKISRGCLTSYIFCEKWTKFVVTHREVTHCVLQNSKASGVLQSSSGKSTAGGPLDPRFQSALGLCRDKRNFVCDDLIIKWGTSSWGEI